MLACGGGSSVRLIVDVRTDLVPGVEFDRVRAVTDEVEEVVSANEGDWIEANRVLDVRDLDRDSSRVVTVEVLLRDEVVVSTRAIVDNRDDAGVTLVLTRDCRGVSCAMNERCFAGSCANEACLDGTQPSCPMAECMTDVDCPSPMQSCARAACVEGVCVEVDDDMCGPTETCDPDDGCVAQPEPDAGAPDGGDMSMDAAVDAFDAGTDAGMVAPRLQVYLEADVLFVNAIVRAPEGYFVVGDVRGEFITPGMISVHENQTAFAMFVEEDGRVRWTTTVAASGLSSFRAGVVNESGGTAAGQFLGTTGVGGGRDGGSRQEPWILTFDLESGGIEGVRFFPADSANAQGRAIAIAPDGASAFGGLYGRNLQLIGELPPAASDDGFFGVFNGLDQLVELPITAGDNTAANAVLSAADRACVGGRFNDDLVFGPIGGFTNPARTDALVACFDRGGRLIWHELFGGADHDSVVAMVEDADETVTVAGYASGAFMVDSVRFNGLGQHDAALFQFDRLGTARWVAVGGGPGIDEVHALARDAEGVVAVGKHGPDSRFGTESFPDPGGFFWQVDLAGRSVRAVQATGEAEISAVASDERGGWVVGIEHTGTLSFQETEVETTRRGVLITSVRP